MTRPEISPLVMGSSQIQPRTRASITSATTAATVARRSGPVIGVFVYTVVALYEDADAEPFRRRGVVSTKDRTDEGNDGEQREEGDDDRGDRGRLVDGDQSLMHVQRVVCPPGWLIRRSPAVKPVGHCRPAGPAGPVSPFGPGGPCGPVGPAGPVATLIVTVRVDWALPTEVATKKPEAPASASATNIETNVSFTSAPSSRSPRAS